MPTPQEVQTALHAFATGDLSANAIDLFKTLGYESERRIEFEDRSKDDFLGQVQEASNFNEKNAAIDEWKYVDMLFQLTESELKDQNLLFDADKAYDDRYPSYLFFTIELSEPTYNRTKLSQITREVNKVFAVPAMILFKYGEYLTLAVIDRQPHKRDEAKDVLRKVTLIKDINFSEPHAAHRLILRDLSLQELSEKNEIDTFADLHALWSKVLDTKELNKRFFRELANWYFWATDIVEFPAGAEPNREVRNATSVIRLITRLMFVWFLKEKRLVPNNLFDRAYLGNVLHFKDDSAYYKAILQNLFFATLNSTMGKREFISQKTFQGKSDQHFVHNLLRYENEFKDSKAAVNDLFDSVPFLNGGLFECLDKSKEERIDGFSNRMKGLVVPDELFFGNEREIDLNETYGTKNKRYKVRGLIETLNQFKFTVAENTPVEEEVALDPELLGMVFESLLANYNPETKTTARKQTGSFYTPRPIVNYMVDESLIAYLKQKLQTETEGFGGFVALGEDQPTMFGNEARIQQKFEMPVNINRWHGKDEELESALRDLFSYSEEIHKFNETETEILIRGIDDCKILDPACGSGAFPMGVLLKLVHILEKLDINNVKWREWQRRKAILESEKTYQEVEDKAERERRLVEINDIFENNSGDYGRKLFLIENCIYGVDIQPIAIQIAKLRFFISLIVDQTATDDSANNRGILPLPNLETKFVAANTLLALDTGGGLKPTGVTDLEKLLKQVRERHFSARSRRTKEKCRAEDQRLRKQIAQLLKDGSIYETTADMIAEWNPYDLNKRADWFDAEYMFGIVNGFDIVIGNPPYVRADSGPDHLEFRKRILESGRFETLWEKWDLYVAFIEHGFKSLKKNGISTMIVSDAYCHSKYAEKSQDWFLKNSKILAIDFLSKIQVFDAAVRNVTYFFQKSDGGNNMPKRRVHETVFGEVTILPTDTQAMLTRRVFFPEDTEETIFDVPTVELREVFYVSKGMVVHADERTVPGAFELNDLVTERKDAIHSKPFVEGKHLSRWLPTRNIWLEWGTKRAPLMFSRPTFREIYEVKEKLISVDMSAGVEQLKVCYDNHQLMHNHSAWSFVPWHELKDVRNKSIKKSARYYDERAIHKDAARREDMEATSQQFDIKYVLGIMNSSFAYNFLRSNRRSNIHLYPDDWKTLPIAIATKEQQSKITILVDQVIDAKKLNIEADTNILENQIDKLVLEIYGLSKAVS